VIVMGINGKDKIDDLFDKASRALIKKKWEKKVKEWAEKQKMR